LRCSGALIALSGTGRNDADARVLGTALRHQLAPAHIQLGQTMLPNSPLNMLLQTGGNRQCEIVNEIGRRFLYRADQLDGSVNPKICISSKNTHHQIKIACVYVTNWLI